MCMETEKTQSEEAAVKSFVCEMFRMRILQLGCRNAQSRVSPAMRQKLDGLVTGFLDGRVCVEARGTAMDRRNVLCW